jgi:hypothetical protein
VSSRQRTKLIINVVCVCVCVCGGGYKRTFPGTNIGECIQKFPDWPPGTRTANGTALC